MSLVRTRFVRLVAAVVAATALTVGLLASSATPASAAIDTFLMITGPEVKGE